VTVSKDSKLIESGTFILIDGDLVARKRSFVTDGFFEPLWGSGSGGESYCLDTPGSTKTLTVETARSNGVKAHILTFWRRR